MSTLYPGLSTGSPVDLGPSCWPSWSFDSSLEFEVAATVCSLLSPPPFSGFSFAYFSFLKALKSSAVGKALANLSMASPSRSSASV